MTGLPALHFDPEDAPLPEGEAIALPAPSGPRVSLRFPSPFEPFLTLDDRRVVEDRDWPSRRLLLWLGRRMPALWRALDERHALRGVLASNTVLVHDVLDVEEACSIDHGLARERLEAAGVLLPGFAVLGAVSTKAELLQRVRSVFAAGATVEVRIEDGGRVISRRRLRLGR